MRYLFRLMMVGVLTALLLALVAVSRGEPIEGISHRGGLSVSVWVGVEPYVADIAVSSEIFPNIYYDFIHFSLDRQVYVYLLDLRPDGEVWLLLSRRLDPGKYNFPSGFLEQFTIPGPVGSHTIQLIATFAPLDLGAEGGRIGTDPTVVLNGLELLIEQKGLGESGWAADRARFDALPSFPFPPTPQGYLAIWVVEKVNDQEIPIPGAEVNINDKGWEWVDQGKRKLRPVGEYILCTRALGFAPDPQCSCWVQVQEKDRPLGPKVFLETCTPRITNKGQTVWVTFILERDDPKVAEFRWGPSRDKLGRSYGPCVGEPVIFDASESRPQEEIVEYEWDFDDLRLPSQKTPTQEITWAFGQAGIHEVKLTVHFRQGAKREVTHQIHVFAQGERYPPCHRSPMIIGHAEAGEDGLKWMKVWNGYASILQELTLPEGIKVGDTVEFKFSYQFKEVPGQGILKGVIEAFSFVSLIVGEAVPLTCYTLLPGKLPDPEAEARGQWKTLTCGSVALTDITKPIQVLIVTNVVDKTGASEIPVHVSYKDIQLVSTNPPPDSPVPALCRQTREEGLKLDKSPAFYYRHPQNPAYRETIVVRFHNKCDFSITLKKWIIRDQESGEPVFEQPNLLTVHPGSFVEWSWEQSDTRPEARGGFAPLCHFYWVELQTENGSPAPLPFVLVPLYGSC